MFDVPNGHCAGAMSAQPARRVYSRFGAEFVLVGALLAAPASKTWAEANLRFEAPPHRKSEIVAQIE